MSADTPRHILTVEWDDAWRVPILNPHGEVVDHMPLDDGPTGEPSEDYSQQVEDRLLRTYGDEEHRIRAAERRYQQQVERDERWAS